MPRGSRSRRWKKRRDENTDVLLIDTAGRLQNKAGLMAELQKIARVLKKLDSDAPHAALLVLDATTGQNAISQVEAFQAAIPLTGLGHDQARRHRKRRNPGCARGPLCTCRSISLASARASTTCRSSMRRHSPGRSQARKPPCQRVETFTRGPIVRTMSPLLKMALDLGPLLIFFAANAWSRAFSPQPRCSWSRSRSRLRLTFCDRTQDFADAGADTARWC